MCLWGEMGEGEAVGLSADAHRSMSKACKLCDCAGLFEGEIESTSQKGKE